jgi:hypothetical protein
MLEDTHTAAKFCRDCSKARPWKDRFCHSCCGTRLTIVCLQCEKELAEGYTHCPYTGKPLAHQYEPEP